MGEGRVGPQIDSVIAKVTRLGTVGPPLMFPIDNRLSEMNTGRLNSRMRSNLTPISDLLWEIECPVTWL